METPPKKYCKNVPIPHWISISLWARWSGLLLEWSYSNKRTIWLLSVPFCVLFLPFPSTVTALTRGTWRSCQLLSKSDFKPPYIKFTLQEFKAIAWRSLACWNVFKGVHRPLLKDVDELMHLAVSRHGSPFSHVVPSARSPFAGVIWAFKASQPYSSCIFCSSCEFTRSACCMLVRRGCAEWSWLNFSFFSESSS